MLSMLLITDKQRKGGCTKDIVTDVIEKIAMVHCHCDVYIRVALGESKWLKMEQLTKSPHIVMHHPLMFHKKEMKRGRCMKDMITRMIK